MASELTVDGYQPEKRQEWNHFVANSRNGTFLFDRGYMDYHADRFQDCSLIVRRGGNIVALVPANRHDALIVSHGGLTYGGLVVGAAMTAPLMMDCLAVCVDWMAAAGITQWDYKTIPSSYHRHPTEEDCYALFRAGAQLSRRDVLSVLFVQDHLPFQERRRRGVRKAAAAGLRVVPSDDWSGFWAVLTAQLSDRHDTQPIHTLAEIELLASRFPDKIRLYTICTESGDVLAGTVIYDTGTVAHAQYIAASDDGLRAGALNLLFSELIEKIYHNCRWFDFGCSNERQGRYLNVGLVEFKEGFGARSICHDYYRIDIDQARRSLMEWRSQ